MNRVVVVFGVVGTLVAIDPSLAQQPISTAQHPMSATAATPQKPAKPHRVVNLKNGSFVIDQPGTWVLNRNWSFEILDVTPLNIIDIVADDIVLDFRGFEIEVDVTPDTAPVNVINVQGARVTLRNARVLMCCGEQGRPLRSTGDGTTIDGSRMAGRVGITLEGFNAVIRDSAMETNRLAVSLGPSGTIENTLISCGSFGCVSLDNDASKLLNSRIRSGGEFAAVRIRGNNSIVAGNLIDWDGGIPFLQAGIEVLGNGNVVRDNTLASAGDTGVVVKVSGSGNVLDGNIGADVGESGAIATGIRFEHDGNFYGDNRMDATVPFDLGGTTQTDWGGNFGY